MKAVRGKIISELLLLFNSVKNEGLYFALLNQPKIQGANNCGSSV